jgi:hypothetical protein
MMDRRRFLGLGAGTVALASTAPPVLRPPSQTPLEALTAATANRIVETPRALLTGDERLGTDDDGPVLSACLRRLSARSTVTSQPVLLNLEGLAYNCATAVYGDNIDGDVSVANGTLFRTSKYGPFAPQDARNNAHLILQGGGRAVVQNVTIRGTNEKGRRSGGYRGIRDHLEQQAGIWARTEHFLSCACNISGVWGDYITLSGRGAGSTLNPMETATVFPGIWERNGRLGLHAQAAEVLFAGGGDASRSVIKSCTSTTYHIEAGDNPRGFMRRHRVENLFQCGGSSRFVHWSGGSAIGTLSVANNLRSGWPVNVYADGERHGDGSPKVKAVSITGNAWDRPQTGDYFVSCNDVGSVFFANNQGPLRSIYPVEDQVITERCISVHADLAGLTN